MRRNTIALLTLLLSTTGIWMEPLRAAEDSRELANAPAAEKSTAEAPSEAEIKEWVAQLDDDRYLVRENASQKLEQAGKPVLELLLATANGKQLEPADRAIWVLRRISRSRDNELAIAALEHLTQLQDRPDLVAKAETELDERNLAICQSHLTRLGAVIAVEPEPFENFNVVLMVKVRLGEKWRGRPEDLKCLADLRRHEHFRFHGKTVNNEVAKLFENKEKLARIDFLETSITPEIVDAIKARHPDAVVYVRGQALLGVTPKNHPLGVVVDRVQSDSAAERAGIVSGDVLVSMDGKPLPDFDRLTAQIAQRSPGETVNLEVIRGADRKTISVTFGKWPSLQE